MAEPAPAYAPVTFEQVYRSEFQALWNWLRRLGVARDIRADFAQETFAIALQRFDSVQPGRPVRPWLFGIAFRVVVGHRRKLSSSMEFTDEALESMDGSANPEQQMFNRQAREWVWRAMQSLSLEQRAIFTLTELEGLSMPEIAAELQIPLNTAYSRLRLARVAMQAWLAKHMTKADLP